MLPEDGGAWDKPCCVHKTSALRLHNVYSYEVAFVTFTDKVNVS